MLLFLVFYTTGKLSTLAGTVAVPMVDYNEDCIRGFNLLEPHRNPVLSASPPLLSPRKNQVKEQDSQQQLICYNTYLFFKEGASK